MPLDDLSLNVTPVPPPTNPAEALEVMTRVLRLPTGSMRQARAIVRMQLDRLSPLPPQTVVYDLVPLRKDGSETVYALGILRKASLTAPGLADRSTVSAVRTLDDVEVVFRFRNPGVAAGWETRWLAHAPKAAIVALGVAIVMLAGQIRADAWRERRLPEIGASQRAEARQARDARASHEAIQEWKALDRADAATRLLCVGSRVRNALPGGVSVSGLTADASRVTLTLPDGGDTGAVRALGAEAPAAASQTVTFPAEVCG